jgi:hypothetical protein
LQPSVKDREELTKGTEEEDKDEMELREDAAGS